MNGCMTQCCNKGSLGGEGEKECGGRVEGGHTETAWKSSTYQGSSAGPGWH